MVSAETGRGHGGVAATEPWSGLRGRRRQRGNVRRECDLRMGSEVAPGAGDIYIGRGAACPDPSAPRPGWRQPGGGPGPLLPEILRPHLAGLGSPAPPASDPELQHPPPADPGLPALPSSGSGPVSPRTRSGNSVPPP